MNVLISGVGGLYGVHTVEQLLSCPDVAKIYGIDDFSRGYPPEEDILGNPWGKKVQIIRAKFQDMTVKELDSLNIDIVIHLAGYNSRKESMNIPEEYFINNEYGTFLLINKLIKTKKRPFFLYSSTTEVYGEPIYIPVDEKHPVNPQNIYAVTKLAAEKHIMAFAKLYNYPVGVMRFTSTFGENQNIYGYTSAISSFIDRALRNEPLIIYGTGSQERDFIYVRDAAKAICLAVINRDKIRNRGINIAMGKLICINDLAEKIIHLTDSASEIIRLPGEKGEPVGVKFDTALALQLLGWSPEYSLEDGISRTICWFKGLRSI